MTRYFFDIVGHGRSQLDYQGRVLPTAESAHDAAETMAFNLAVRSENETIGWTVNVSNTEGQKLFSIPVQASCLAAA
jgi:hypothetical protein